MFGQRPRKRIKLIYISTSFLVSFRCPLEIAFHVLIHLTNNIKPTMLEADDPIGNTIDKVLTGMQLSEAASTLG